MRELVDVDFPEAERISVVLDNLSTHTAAALHKARTKMARAYPDPSLKESQSLCRGTRCLVSAFDGSFLSSDSKDALWARFFTGAPRRQRRCVERYSIVMSGRRSQIKGCLA